VFLLLAVIWPVLLHKFDVYRWRFAIGYAQTTLRVVTAVVVATVALTAAVYLTYQVIPRILLSYFVVIDAALLVGSRLVAARFVRASGLLAQRAVVVGSNPTAQHLASSVSRSWYSMMKVVGMVEADGSSPGASKGRFPTLGRADDLELIVQEQAIDVVLIALPFYERTRLVGLVRSLQALDVEVGVVPDNLDIALTGPVAEVGGVPVLSPVGPAMSRGSRLIKRAFDITVASLALLVLSPLMLAIAVAIWLDSPGNPVFCQMRVGQSGRLFGMFKFRSMYVDADARLEAVAKTTPDGKVVHKLPEDPRVTRMGRLIRRTSLDELPQLVNVVLGQMSLVGPRPELPFIVQHYEPWQWARFSVPQGMTGWWQINGRSERLMHLHTEDDLYYISNYSFWLDLRIIWRTAFVVLGKRGAY
jgi:exopolysaccharide biosynthesis polyprenyl glycosylphosphotransferase